MSRALLTRRRTLRSGACHLGKFLSLAKSPCVICVLCSLWFHPALNSLSGASENHARNSETVDGRSQRAEKPADYAGAHVMEQIAEELEALHKLSKDAIVRVRAQTPIGILNGTGFLIDDQGHIVTASSLLPEGGEVAVEYNGPEVSAHVVGIDRPSSVALLKAPLADVKYLKFRQGVAIQAGTAVVILGFPFHGDSSPLFTLASGQDRALPDGRMLCASHLRMNIPLTPGMIGSPLLDTRGSVSGIVTGTAAEGRLTYALPTPALRRVLADLQEFGRVRRGWIGVELEERRSLETGRPLMLVTKIYPNTPAEEYGILPGDVIVSLDGREIHDRFDMIEAAFHTRVGSQVPVLVLRDGQELVFHITIVERPDDIPFVESRPAQGLSRAVYQAAP